MYNSFHLPFWGILGLVLMVVFAIFLLPILVRLLPFFTKNTKLKMRTSHIGVFVQRLVWGLIAFFALVIGIQINLVLGFIFTIVILVAARFYVFNYVSGLAMYFSSEFGEKNREIFDDKIKGRIKKIGVFYSEIEQAEGHVFYIENTQLRVLKVTRTTQASDGHPFTFLHEVPNNKSLNLLKEELNDRLLNNAFVKVDHPIKIEPEDLKDDIVVFKITVYGDDEDAISQVSRMLNA